VPPTQYTEAGLADYMIRTVGPVMASTLGWTGADQLDDAVAEVMLTLRVSDLAEIPASSVQRLRALARVEAWRLATRHLASRVDFASDNQQFKLSQLQTQAAKSLEIEEAALAELADNDTGANTAVIIPVYRSHDPYGVQPDDGVPWP
jgi:hypothetical protein